MIAFIFNSAARSRIASSSCCCSAVVRFERDGQSRLSTVATQIPRNSRTTAGGRSESRVVGACAVARSGSASRAPSTRILSGGRVERVARRPYERRLRLEGGRDTSKLDVGVVPASALDRLTRAGHRLYAVARVQPGRVQQVLVPRPRRK